MEAFCTALHAKTHPHHAACIHSVIARRHKGKAAEGCSSGRHQYKSDLLYIKAAALPRVSGMRMAKRARKAKEAAV